MPAFGSSDKIDSAWGVEDYADWLNTFVSLNGIYGADIIAHSFGARVAIMAISQDNSLCNKLIITGGAGIVKQRSAVYMRRVNWYRRIKKLFPKFAEKHFGSEEYRALSPMMKDSYKKIVNRDLKVEAAKVNNPVLLIYGKEDGVTPADEEGKIFASLMPNSRLVTIEGDHFCFCKSPQTFNALALSFLSGQN